MIDLQHMMNPLGPSPKAVEAIKNNLHNIHKYTSPLRELVQKIAIVNSVKENQILLSDGADGALTLIAQAMFKNKRVIVPLPCFHRYKDYSSFLGVDHTFIPPKDSFFIDEDKVLQSKGEILLLASPNNPTGFEISESFLLHALRMFELVILDETLLFSFAGKQSLLLNFQNLIIVRSFSKLGGLAGLRIGYVIAAFEHIAVLKSFSTPFKVNYLGQIAALAMLDDTTYIESSKDFIIEERKRLFKDIGQRSIELSCSLCYCLTLTEKHVHDLKKSVLFSDHFDFGISEKSIFRFCIGQSEQNVALGKLMRGSL